MRVEVAVDWGRVAGKPRQDNALNDLAPPRSRAERRLWYVAVAREIEAGVRSGRFSSYADAARRCGVSRVRISRMFRAYPRSIDYSDAAELKQVPPPPGLSVPDETE